MLKKKVEPLLNVYGQRAFAGLTPSRPAYICPWWKVVLVRPFETRLHEAWTGVSDNTPKLFDKMAMDMWNAETEVVFALGVRIPAGVEASCPRTYYYWWEDVCAALDYMAEQCRGGSSETRFRVEHIRGERRDCGVAIFSGRRRDPPLIEGFATRYFTHGHGKDRMAWTHCD